MMMMMIFSMPCRSFSCVSKLADINPTTKAARTATRQRYDPTSNVPGSQDDLLKAWKAAGLPYKEAMLVDGRGVCQSDKVLNLRRRQLCYLHAPLQASNLRPH